MPNVEKSIDIIGKQLQAHDSAMANMAQKAEARRHMHVLFWLKFNSM